MWKIHIQLDEETREREIRESENSIFSTVESSSAFPLQFLPSDRSAFVEFEDCDVTSAPTSKQTSTTPKDDNKSRRRKKKNVKMSPEPARSKAKK